MLTLATRLEFVPIYPGIRFVDPQSVDEQSPDIRPEKCPTPNLALKQWVVLKERTQTPSLSEGNKARRKRKMKQSRPQANGVSTPPKVDYTAGGLDAPIPSGPARLVGYRYNCNGSSLCVENQHPPA